MGRARFVASSYKSFKKARYFEFILTSSITEQLMYLVCKFSLFPFLMSVSKGILIKGYRIFRYFGI